MGAKTGEQFEVGKSYPVTKVRGRGLVRLKKGDVLTAAQEKGVFIAPCGTTVKINHKKGKALQLSAISASL